MPNKKYADAEILYEEAESGNSGFPFIKVKKDEQFPPLIFLAEMRETNEYDELSNGQVVPIMEWELHSLVSMEVLKKKLDTETLNKVRHSIGLKDLKTAIKDGQKISANVRQNIGEKQKKQDENNKTN